MIDLTAALVAMREARDMLGTEESVDSVNQEARTRAKVETALAAARAWTSLSDEELASRFEREAIAKVVFDDDPPVRVTIPFPETDGSFFERDGAAAEARCGLQRRGLWLQGNRGGMSLMRDTAAAPVREACARVVARAKVEADYDRKSAEADRLVRVTEAYLSGLPPPDSTDAALQSLARALPPDLVGSVTGMARGTLADDILAHQCRKGFTGELEWVLPVPGTVNKCQDTQKLLMRRVRLDHRARRHVDLFWRVPYDMMYVRLTL